MSRMPCRVTDDPYYDYSDYVEQKGVYAITEDDNYEEEDDEYIRDRERPTSLNISTS